MSRCREDAGILFQRKCNQPAVGQCGQCNKPICQTHGRNYWQSVACVSCLREMIKKQPQQRQSQAHLRDDPYFHWYFVDDQWMHESYSDHDYGLFDDHDGDLAPDHGGGWEGT